MIIAAIIGGYLTGVVVFAAAFQASPIFRSKYDGGELAVISYLWPLIAILVVAAIPYDIGKAIGQKLGKER